MNLLITTALRNFSLFFIVFFSVLYIARAEGCPPYMSAEECDLCGCTSGGNFGYGTLGNTNFAGLRYIYQRFESKDGIFDNSPTSEEHFNTYQLWAKVPVTKNIYVTGTLPYQDLRRNFNNRSEHINGLGDISVLGWYRIQFKKKQEQNSAPLNFLDAVEYTGHSLEFGVGIKLPTGEFEEMLTDRVNPGFQVGTGSTDGIFSVAYGYNKDRLGANATASYYLKGENKNQYQFGDQFSYNANVYYGFPINLSMLTPFLGISGDSYQTIEQYGEELANTNGYNVIGSLGGEYSYKRFVLGANYGIPLAQNLFGGNVEMKHRLLLYLNYTL